MFSNREVYIFRDKQTEVCIALSHHQHPLNIRAFEEKRPAGEVLVHATPFVSELTRLRSGRAANCRHPMLRIQVTVGKSARLGMESLWTAKRMHLVHARPLHAQNSGASFDVLVDLEAVEKAVANCTRTISLQFHDGALFIMTLSHFLLRTTRIPAVLTDQRRLPQQLLLLAARSKRGPDKIY
jgi:hypothetical protein